MIAVLVVCVIFGSAGKEPGQGKSVAALIDALSKGATKRRIQAARALGEQGSEAEAAVPELVRALREGPEDLDMVCAWALAQIGPASVPALVPLVDTTSPRRTREVAAAALRRIGRAAVLPLEQELKDADYRTRKSAAVALGILGPHAEAAVPRLLLAIKDEYSIVRKYAALALGQIGARAPLVVPELVKALADSDESVRAGAAASLGSFGPEARGAVAALIHALSDSHTPVRAGTARALGRIGADKDQVLEALRGALADNHSAVRRAAIVAVGHYGAEARGVLPALAALLDDRDAALRVAVCASIGRIGSDAASVVPKLVPLLRDRQSAVRAAAALALGRIGLPDRTVIHALMTSLRDREAAVCAEAARALGLIGSDAASATTTLVKRLSHEDERVRMHAAAAIGRIARAERRTVSALKRALKDEAALVRIAAARALWRLDPEAEGVLTILISGMQDQDKAVRRSAIEAVAELGIHQEVGSAFTQGLEDKDALVRLTVAGTIWRIDREVDLVVPAVILLVKHRNPQVRTRVKELLGSIATSAEGELISYLISAVTRGTGELRRDSIEILGTLGEGAKAAVPALTEVMRAGTDLLKLEAARALWRIERNAETVLPVFVALMRSTDSSIRFRTKPALRAVAVSIGSAVVPRLLATMRAPDRGFRTAMIELLRTLAGSPEVMSPERGELLGKALDQAAQRPLSAIEIATLRAKMYIAMGTIRSAVIAMEDVLAAPEATSEQVREVETLRAHLLPDLVSYASIDAALAAPDVLLTQGAEWSFFRGKKEPSDDLAWTAPAFDDSSWERGPGGFGYGDGDDQTVLSDMAKAYTTLYLRRRFEIAHRTALSALTLRVLVDDGFVAYLNGAEVGRTAAGTPGTRLAFDAVATDIAHEPLVPFECAIDLRHVQAGANVLAIQGLNRSLDSSDFSLIPVLIAAYGADQERDRERFQKSFEAFKKGGSPDGALRAAYLEGRLLQRAGKLVEAEEKFTAVLAADATRPEPALRKVELLVLRGAYREAEKVLRDAIAGGRSPDDGLWDQWFGLSAVRLGQGLEAIRAALPVAADGAVSARGEAIRWALACLGETGAIRLNAGGEEYRAPDGTVWSRDRFFRSGDVFRDSRTGRQTYTGTIDGTALDPIFQTERWFPASALNPAAYDIPAPPGRYRVILHFAELVFHGSTDRLFHVILEGTQVLTRYEPIVRGFATADSRTFTTEVRDGFLTIEFVHHTDNPTVSAIEVQCLP